MFCVAMAVAFGVEVVVFSPASRASRKLLERMHEAQSPPYTHVENTHTK